MDALLKKYADVVEKLFNNHHVALGELARDDIKLLLLKFLLEYVELRENKKEK